MNRETKLRVVAMIALMLLLLSSTWAGTSFLTSWLYHRVGYTLPRFLDQLINSVLGLLLFMAAIAAYTFWIASRPHIRPHIKRSREGIFTPIIEALGRIAQGDFQVRLEPAVEAHALMGALAKTVNRVAEELSQMEHMRQEFIANVSHEIQSPLTAIRGFVQVLYNEQLRTEERQHYLAIIEMESTRLSRMTENMLKLAALESESRRLERKAYRLDKQLRGLILACEPLWVEKGVEMDVELAEVEICADEDLLGQVWSNLLQNSIKFTLEGGCVKVEVRQCGQWIECQVIDSGIGIPEEAQARIFERFYKVDAARERAREGSGLGLAIAKKIVNLHGGTIRVASKSGVGTKMSIILPVE